MHFHKCLSNRGNVALGWVSFTSLVNGAVFLLVAAPKAPSPVAQLCAPHLYPPVPFNQLINQWGLGLVPHQILRTQGLWIERKAGKSPIKLTGNEGWCSVRSRMHSTLFRPKPRTPSKNLLEAGQHMIVQKAKFYHVGCTGSITPCISVYWKKFIQHVCIPEKNSLGIIRRKVPDPFQVKASLLVIVHSFKKGLRNKIRVQRIFFWSLNSAVWLYNDGFQEFTMDFAKSSSYSMMVI